MDEKNTLDKHAEFLLNGGIDGELSAGEEQERQRLLDESDEALVFNEELKSLVQSLDELPQLESPPHLQESIERQVRLPVHDNDGNRKWGAFVAWLSTRGLRTSLALAAGVVMMVAVFEMESERLTDMDESNLVGTVVKNQQPGQAILLDSVRIANDTLTGLVELRKSGALYNLSVQLDSGGPTALLVEFDETRLSFEGVSRILGNDEAVNIADGSVRIAGNGTQHYQLKLRHSMQTPVTDLMPLSLQFYNGNNLVHRIDLEVLRQ